HGNKNAAFLIQLQALGGSTNPAKITVRTKFGSGIKINVLARQIDVSNLGIELAFRKKSFVKKLTAAIADAYYRSVKAGGTGQGYEKARNIIPVAGVLRQNSTGVLVCLEIFFL